MEENEPLLKAAQDFVTRLYEDKVNKTVQFHTIQHTEDVVSACKEIASAYQLSQEDNTALLLAAWFHDTGFSSGQAKDHETVSIQIAADFLVSHSVPEPLIQKVAGCIEATRMPQTPRSLIETIICDADLFHLGTETYREKHRLLRAELRKFGDEDFSKKDWRGNNIGFLETHKYFTSYGKEKLQPVKEQNLAKLKEKQFKQAGKPAQKGSKEKKQVQDKPAIKTEDPGSKKTKDNQTERGISTVFRIMAQTQNNLSQMADSKANILISVNAIILSIVISSLFTELQKKPNLQIPVVLLVILCVTVIVFAILSTRPNVNRGTFTEDDIRQKKTNLLFFGNFHGMGLKEYDWAMTEMLNDRNYLYGSIVKDNYFLGVVLAKKYRLLRIAYNIFMYGLIIVMVAFAIAALVPEAGEIYT